MFEDHTFQECLDNLLLIGRKLRDGFESAVQGRFTSSDEFTGGPDEFYEFHDLASLNATFYADLTDPQSLNKYVYCYNNPLLYIDLDGHLGIREWARRS